MHCGPQSSPLEYWGEKSQENLCNVAPITQFLNTGAWNTQNVIELNLSLDKSPAEVLYFYLEFHLFFSKIITDSVLDFYTVFLGILFLL